MVQAVFECDGRGQCVVNLASTRPPLPAILSSLISPVLNHVCSTQFCYSRRRKAEAELRLPPVNHFATFHVRLRAALALAPFILLPSQSILPKRTGPLVSGPEMRRSSLEVTVVDGMHDYYLMTSTTQQNDHSTSCRPQVSATVNASAAESIQL